MTTMTTSSSLAGACRQPARPGLLRRALGLAALYRQRRALSRLDDKALADIGLTRAEARSEADRPVWDVPGNWRF